MATGYNRVYNTVLSGNEAQSSLSGNDVRMLEFDAALKRRPKVSLVGGSSVSLSVEDWMQASIDTLLLLPPGAGVASISVGTDSATQAAAYVQLFDLRSTGDQRVLRMAIQTAVVANVNLVNDSVSDNYVQIKLDDAFVAPASETLFTTAVAPNSCAGSRAGLERLVVVSASDLSSGAEIVKFNILSGSL